MDSKPSASICLASSVIGGPNQQKLAVIPIFIRTSPWTYLAHPSFPRTRESSFSFAESWTPAFAGVTLKGFQCE
jgi:hypothetical protein